MMRVKGDRGSALYLSDFNCGFCPSLALDFVRVQLWILSELNCDFSKGRSQIIRLEISDGFLH